MRGKKKTTEQFIADAKAVHGDKYDYSKVVYVNGKSKVIITCPTHGDFKQTPNSHLKGCGCSKCAIETRAEKFKSSTEDFIAKARAIHGDKYDYSKTVYEGAHTEVKIICPEHGVFERTAHCHLPGAGCPQCSEWSIPDSVYLLTDSDYKPTRMKIGVTSNLKRRLGNLRGGNAHSGLQPTPFKIFKKACCKVGTGKAYEIEQLFHRYYASRNLGYTGFDGATEWFEYDAQAEKLLAEIAANMKATA